MNPIKVQQTVSTPLQDVWEALTEPAKMKEWYFEVEGFKMEMGNIFRFYGDNKAKTFLHVCELLDFVPNQSLVHTWTHPEESKGSSILKWQLYPIDDNNTRIELEHSGVEQFSDAGRDFARESYEFGWKGIVTIGLRNFLHGIQKQIFEIEIEAPRKHVWNKMWEKYSFSKWQSYDDIHISLEGTLEAGKTVHIIDQEGNGYFSDVLFVKKGQLLVLSHIGLVAQGNELDATAATDFWTGIMETYQLIDNGEHVKIVVERDSTADNKANDNKAISAKLEKLKFLCESSL